MPLKVLPRTQRKLTNQRLNNFDDEDDTPAGPDELTVHRGYGRPKIVHENDNSDELSPYVQIRLLIARMKAINKYREIYSQA